MLMKKSLEELIRYLPTHEAQEIQAILLEFPELSAVMQERLEAKVQALQSEDPSALAAIAKQELVLAQAFSREVSIATAKNSLSL